MIKLDKNYSEHVETGDPKYPFGKGVRSSGPNQFDGTPWLELLMNDIHGAKTALFKAAFGNNKDVSGNPDTVSASDFVDSLLEFVIKRKISELSACSSAELAAKISDETGTGKLVFSDTPTLNNPIVGTQAVTDNSTKAASTAFANSFLQNKLGNVPNVTTNDQTPSYSVAGSDTNLSSGEKLTTAFGKIARAVSSFLSHIGSRSNPHGVTKAQVGLGSADNTADANKLSAFANQLQAFTNDNFTGGDHYVKAIRDASGWAIRLWGSYAKGEKQTDSVHVNYANSAGWAGSAGNADTLDGYHAGGGVNQLVPVIAANFGESSGYIKYANGLLIQFGSTYAGKINYYPFSFSNVSFIVFGSTRTNPHGDVISAVDRTLSSFRSVLTSHTGVSHSGTNLTYSFLAIGK